MLKRIGHKQNSISESVLIDYIRYVLIKCDDSSTSGSTEGVYRWLILGHIYKHLKSEIYKALAK